MWPSRKHRSTVADFAPEAESLVLRVCEQHNLFTKKEETSPIELLMTIPAQSGLSHEITVGLQNNDELNLGIGEFWSYFFPFVNVKEHFEIILDGFISGGFRVAEYRHRGMRRPFKCLLEQQTGTQWQKVYTAGSLRQIPFIPWTTRYLLNEAAASKPDGTIS